MKPLFICLKLFYQQKIIFLSYCFLQSFLQFYCKDNSYNLFISLQIKIYFFICFNLENYLFKVIQSNDYYFLRQTNFIGKYHLMKLFEIMGVYFIKFKMTETKYCNNPINFIN
jgi:hypothetical protein